MTDVPRLAPENLTLAAAGFTISARLRSGGGLATYRASAKDALLAACAYQEGGATEIRIRQDYGAAYTLDEFSRLHLGARRSSPHSLDRPLIRWIGELFR